MLHAKAWVNQNLGTMKTTIIYLLSIFLQLSLVANETNTEEPSSLDLNLENVKTALQIEANEVLLSFTQNKPDEKATPQAATPEAPAGEDSDTVINQSTWKVASKD